ncbi:MAG: VOC family protein [Pirellulales bacterium]
MSAELDHFFICTSRGAPEVEQLARFGLAEGAPNRHPGQGTANRRFFFENAFLELLWVEDPTETQSALVRRTGLWERWSNRCDGASPFGVCLRSAGTEPSGAPFATWEYRPPYLPAPLVIHMSASSQISQSPLLFYIAFGRRPDADDPSRRQPLKHPAGLRAITRLEIAVPMGSQSHPPEQEALEQQCSDVRVVGGSGHLVEVSFDGRKLGQTADFRPALPLVFHW